MTSKGLLAAWAMTLATSVAATPIPIASFGDGEPPGVFEASSLGPNRGSCSAADALFESDRPAAASVLSGEAAPRGTRVLRLATEHSPTGDDLAQVRWRLPFESQAAARVELTLALRTRDDAAFGDWFLVLLDGVPIVCGEAAALELEPVAGSEGLRTSAWMDVGGALVAPGTHSLEVVLGDGTDSTGLSELLIESVGLVVLGGLDPCRPRPPENAGEVVWEGSVDPFGQTWGGSTPTLWTFDDNRFCPEGPGLACNRPQDLDGDGDIEDWEVVNPNPGMDFVNGVGTLFEMYVVADCGTEMHVPLFDVESGTISVRDPDGDPVVIRVTNFDDLDQTGLVVTWKADNCNGIDPSTGQNNQPGGFGNEVVIDVSFQGTPTLCGVYTVEFTDWAGCIWELFANCDGSDDQQFNIYDDKCEAQLAVNPLPELIVDNLRVSQGTGCSVNYCVDYRNIGCDLALPSTVRVSNQFGAFNHLVPSLDAGDFVTLCGTLSVTGTGNVSTQVLAVADFGNLVEECSEADDASSCDPVSGGDFVQRTILVSCADPPECDAGGPYVAPCLAASGGTFIQLDGTGSFDPDGGTLEYSWTTNCIGAEFDDPLAARPVLRSTDDRCRQCTVTLTIRDDEGSSESCSATVSITDNTPPELTCPVDREVECSDETADRDAWMDTAVATDTCDPDVEIQATLVGFNEPCIGTRSEIWRFRALDGCGNDDICFARWDVVDMLPPVVTPPPPREVECGSAGPNDLILWLLQAEGEDACTGSVTVLNELVSVTAGCGNTEVRRYRFHAEDPCGNEGEAFSTYATVDTTAPELQGVPADDEADCDDVPAAPTVTADDACQGESVVDPQESRIAGDCPDSYTLVRTWTFADACGNDVSASQTIEVVDDEPPQFVGLPGNLLASCDDVPRQPDVTATDDCGPDPEVGFVQTRQDGPCPDTYVLTRTWTAEDRCGNVATAVRTVTVTDGEPPELHDVPSGGIVECGLVPQSPDVTATDNCDPEPDVELVQLVTPGTCAGEATILRTWTATDRCGRQAVATQVLLVRDTTDPELSSRPADDTVECDDVPDAEDVQVTDNCDTDPDVDVQEERTDGACEDEYVLTRTWTASDECGNSVQHVQVLTVRDTTDPELHGVPADTDAECDDVPAPAEPTATDNCDLDPEIEADQQRVDGDCPDSYSLVRTWTATDNCGHTATATQTITVRDTTDPEIHGVPADTDAECNDVPAAAEPTATDNCDLDPEIEADQQRVDGDCPDSYSLVRTWTATDNCGNTATATQTVTVRDTTDPELHGVPEDTDAECDDVPAAAEPTATDNCDLDPEIEADQQRVDGDCPDSYSLVRTWTATDNCGNTVTATQTITVRDTTDPELHGVPEDTDAECDDVPAAAEPTATDNCDLDPEIELDQQRVDGDCPDSYSLVRTWTATDNCGNTATATQTVTVRDTTDPELHGVPEDDEVECDEVPDAASPTATDNCDLDPDIDFDERRVDGPCPGQHVLLRTWTATDACGNTASETQTLTVLDTRGPGVTPDPHDDACIWPPNHWYVCFGREDFHPLVQDACSDPSRWDFVGCASDQPDDAPERGVPGGWNGDGATINDCVVAPDGSGFCVRAERAGTGPNAQAGRHYGVAILAFDECDNPTGPVVIGTLHVPHDQSPRERGCIKSTHEGLRPNQPLPWGTTRPPRR